MLTSDKKNSPSYIPLLLMIGCFSTGDPGEDAEPSAISDGFSSPGCSSKTCVLLKTRYGSFIYSHSRQKLSNLIAIRRPLGKRGKVPRWWCVASDGSLLLLSYFARLVLPIGYFWLSIKKCGSLSMGKQRIVCYCEELFPMPLNFQPK